MWEMTTNMILISNKNLPLWVHSSTEKNIRLQNTYVNFGYLLNLKIIKDDLK